MFGAVIAQHLEVHHHPGVSFNDKSDTNVQLVVSWYPGPIISDISVDHTRHLPTLLPVVVLDGLVCFLYDLVVVCVHCVEYVVHITVVHLAQD